MMDHHIPNTRLFVAEATNEPVIEFDARSLESKSLLSVLRAGDVVKCSVKHHKPTKILQAEHVQLASFNDEGREVGVVVATKENGYGFIQSTSRAGNIFFHFRFVLTQKKKKKVMA
jgi:hypothetical protein